MNPCIAIIDRNTLTCISLQNMLWNIYNHVEVYCYRSIDTFIRDSNRHFVHFFVESGILFSHIDEFETLKQQTTVISTGPHRQFTEAGFSVLDISMPEAEISGRLLHLQFVGRHGTQEMSCRFRNSRGKLSEREQEVLALMIKGLINKEIAQKLNISLPTVIFHRNNICEKLQTRSLGRLTVFGILSGIVDINEI